MSSAGQLPCPRSQPLRRRYSDTATAPDRTGPLADADMVAHAPRRTAGPRQNHPNKMPREETHMTKSDDNTPDPKHDETRRAFLVGAALGAAAGAGLVPEARAQEH